MINKLKKKSVFIRCALEIKCMLLVFYLFTCSSCSELSIHSKEDYVKYLHILNDEETAYFNREMSTCIELYKEAKRYKMPEEYYGSLATVCALKNDDHKLALDIFKASIKYHQTNPNNFYHSADIQEYFNEDEWKELVELAENLKEKNDNNYEVRLRKMISKDQFVRNLYNNVNCDISCLDQIMDLADYENLRELKKLVDEHGWQPEFWLILWHQRGGYPDSETWNTFKPNINRAIELGREKPHFWAQFEDFLSYTNGEAQKYGTVIIYDKELKSQKIYTTVSDDSLAYNRYEVGLGPIQNYCLRSQVVCVNE